MVPEAPRPHRHFRNAIFDPLVGFRATFADRRFADARAAGADPRVSRRQRARLAIG